MYPVYIDYICYRDEQVPVYSVNTVDTLYLLGHVCVWWACYRDEQVPVYSVNTVDTLYLLGRVCVRWACHREVPARLMLRLWLRSMCLKRAAMAGGTDSSASGGC